MTPKTSKELNKKYDTYLTDMKELPPEPDTVENAELEVKKEKPNSLPKNPVVSKIKNTQNPIIKESQLQKQAADDELIVDEEKEALPFSSKDIILAVVNLISVVLLIVLLVRLPSKANELNSLRKEDVQSRDIAYDSLGFTESKKKADGISKLFLTDNGVVDFVSDVEKIKNADGIITKVSFVSPQRIKDKTGNSGLAVSIELSGSWEGINQSLMKIDSLPYLIRPVSIDISRSKDDSQVIIYKYGLFLYTSAAK